MIFVIFDCIFSNRSTFFVCVYLANLYFVARTSAYPNFVISTGCDVPPEIPLDNIRAFYEAVKDYNQKQ